MTALLKPYRFWWQWARRPRRPARAPSAVSSLATWPVAHSTNRLQAGLDTPSLLMYSPPKGQLAKSFYTLFKARFKRPRIFTGLGTLSPSVRWQHVLHSLGPETQQD